MFDFCLTREPELKFAFPSELKYTRDLNNLSIKKAQYLVLIFEKLPK